jgi:ParB family chromosome partitioning protein
MKKSFTVSGLVDSGTIQNKPNASNFLKFKDQSDFTSNTVLNIPLSKIEPNPYQPRRIFPQNEIEKLASSISEVGLLQPIAVRKQGHQDAYQIIAGERRFKAFEQLNKTEIPGFVFVCDDSDLAVMAIVENVNREDLSDYEIGKAIRAVEMLFPSKTRLAEACGFQREDMYRYFSFEDLPEFLIEKLDVNPRLLSRNASSEIKRVLSKISPEYYDLAIVILKNAISLLENNEIDQTKIAQHISLSMKSSMLEINDTLTKRDEFIIDGRKIGHFTSSPNGVTIKFINGILDKEKKEQLQSIINNFLNELINK